MEKKRMVQTSGEDDNEEKETDDDREEENNEEEEDHEENGDLGWSHEKARERDRGVRGGGVRWGRQMWKQFV